METKILKEMDRLVADDKINRRYGQWCYDWACFGHCRDVAVDMAQMSTFRTLRPASCQVRSVIFIDEHFLSRTRIPQGAFLLQGFSSDCLLLSIEIISIGAMHSVECLVWQVSNIFSAELTVSTFFTYRDEIRLYQACEFWALSRIQKFFSRHTY
jgi:hypothetical protein